MGNSGRFVWYELLTTDIETAKTFYSSVVGWGTADVSRPGSVYTLFTAGGATVAGLAKLQPDAQKAGVPPQWMGFVEVGDVDAAAGRVKQLGGTVHVPPTDVPNVSRFSVIADPQMATLALFKGREGGHETSARPGAPGHVVWCELLASDWERAFTFYNELLGWQKVGAHVGPMGTYQEFSAGRETIGGMFTPPEMWGFSMWLYYFSAGDIEAALKRVVAGGGQILYGPIAVPGAARIVQCSDPQGAVFGLMERRFRISIGCYSPRHQR
jgi:predicted enzyme related to lactoylglutathione lyase